MLNMQKERGGMKYLLKNRKEMGSMVLLPFLQAKPQQPLNTLIMINLDMEEAIIDIMHHQLEILTVIQ
ncbi:hypothetical protein ES703_33288 [subsurface metagenome]